jgi:S1-C subfamily serine protease
MRGTTSSRWCRCKRLTTAAMLAIGVLVATELASGSSPLASLSPAGSPVVWGSLDRRREAVITGVIYSWRGLLMQRAPTTGRKSNDGLLVEQVEPDSPAARLKLKPGDIITGLDGIPVDTARSLAMAIADHCCGPTVSLSLWQDHHFRHIELPPMTPRTRTIAGQNGTTDPRGLTGRPAT